MASMHEVQYGQNMWTDSDRTTAERVNVLITESVSYVEVVLILN